MSSEVFLFSSRDSVNYEVITFSSQKNIYIFHKQFLYCAENIFNFFEGLWIVKQFLSYKKGNLKQYQKKLSELFFPFRMLAREDLWEVKRKKI